MKLRHPTFLLTALFLAGCTLSAPPPERGDAPILTPQPPASGVEFELPSRKPSAANGAQLYAEKCAACHGATGQGDGERATQVREQFGAAPADLTADSSARALTPAEWYTAITNGRLERGMPPFNGSLSIDERWDVIVYAWSLGSPESTLAAGQVIYAERCVHCHGETGKGDSSQSDGALPDLSTLAAYRDVAPGEWDSLLDTSHVPSFSGKLSRFERSAVNDYIRSFTYNAAVLAAPLPPTPPAGPDASSVPGPAAGAERAVNGSIVNGTQGASVPAGLDVSLYIFAGGTGDTVVTRTLRADATGRFSAAEPDTQPGDVVAATVMYADVTYPSPLVEFDGAIASADLQITIYEPTTDTAAIHIDTLHLVVMPRSQAIDVNEIYVLSNLGDRVIRNLDGPALRFKLPPGIAAFQVLQGAAEGAIVQSPEGFDFYDAVAPGSQTVQLVIAYQLPRSAAEIAFDRAAPYPTGSVSVIVQDSDLAPSSGDLVDRGPQVIQDQTYRQFSGGPLQAGQRLTFRLSPPAAGANVQLIGGILLIAAGVAAVGYGVWRSRQREERPTTGPGPARQQKDDGADPEQLLDQIAALDDAFAAGEIDETAYRKKRDALKKKALRLMN